ncbi:hypothetical protein LK994_12495 [Ferruginibacter lapsinanis]|uniref:hypothetical protein n=1 Tax=Ferruginibacter lapsinanis TaxID=563172 RepID=UPI001E2BCE22|nr:hypothetical protein [Ferruginibacter lapsinanis]UEG49452.1 hypothetical protein LK994_12495 [Ferruginibacter lapsinanis]
METNKEMKKILIISPHYPPSNLAAVHRSRLFAQHLPEFGWEPIILTVDEKYYEEKLDWNLHKLLPANQRIEKVNAFNVTKPRIIGDVGLRGFFQLYKKAKALIKSEKIDFLYIPIPSFYIALLGRWLHTSTGVKYGIDYIDPWVHHFPGSDKIFTRHWFSTKIAKFLEPIAIKKASLITGVAEGYYKGVIERNPYLLKSCLFGAMPYGGEKTDHEKLAGLNIEPYLFVKDPAKFQMVYAGAMLPKAYEPLEAIFKSIAENPAAFATCEIHFIGTGKLPNDPNSYNIKPLAEKYNLWNTVVFEYAQRIPYLDVLVHLNAAQGVFILGSTEPHYTPSKVYQAVLSHKPIFAILHMASSAKNVIEKSNSGIVLGFNGEAEIEKIAATFTDKYKMFLSFCQTFSEDKVLYDVFEEYSAKSVTKSLSDLLNKLP